MVTKRLFRSALHQHADPARRVVGAAQLTPESAALAALLATDPAPEVRVAAASRCANLGALTAAWENETDPRVRVALAAALETVLSATRQSAQATAWLDAEACTDAIRAAVARRAADLRRRRSAIVGIREEAPLIELALSAEHAETRMAAAERVRTPEGLSRLAAAAKNKDRGVARLARKRIDALASGESHAAEADAIVAQLEALATQPGPILTPVVELNRRWQALNLSDDPTRSARCEAARQTLQARFDREHAERRARLGFEHRLSEWLGRADPPATPDQLAGRRSELAALCAEARTYADSSTRSGLDAAQRRIERWAQELQALAGAEALVCEAERLAAGTFIDHAKLPERWQALERSTRTGALTRRFEAALMVVEQRRLAQIRVVEQEAHAVRQRLHGLLQVAEQALAAGQLQAALAAADAIRAVKPGAGLLPKPTLQRLSRLTQQLTELEGWESFGQHQARLQLCERAEAAITLAVDPAQLAVEVQNLRQEWKALDQQHAGVPRALWERFDRACEKAYAPVARYFAQRAALRKQARRQREEFIAAAAAHAPTLLAEPRDWRAIERWLRATDRRWQDGDPGSVEPKARTGLDARLRTALAPLRDALSAARDEAKARRLALLEEATALAPKAMARDAPAQVKAIQAKWQAQAKELSLAQRDERALWEQFRSACDAVFAAREAKRKQEEDVQREGRRALEDICVRLEQLASATDQEDQPLRRALRDLQAEWKQRRRTSDPTRRGVESRFTKAETAVDAALLARSRAREAAVWRTLAAKERLCENLDRLLCSRGNGADAAAAANAQWTALPVLPRPWEKAMLGRRDAALGGLADEAAAAAYLTRIQRGAESRREMLLELEMQLGLECPPELEAQRLALRLKRLRERFQGATTSGTDSAGERLLAWCAQPGVADALDRQRCDRLLLALERAR